MGGSGYRLPRNIFRGPAYGMWVMCLDRLKNALLALLLALFAAALLLFPAESGGAAREGLALCLQTVLPSLFPFFVLSALLIDSGGGEFLSGLLAGLMRPLFALSGDGAAALVLGLAGGYPVGARTAAELYRSGRLSRDEAERLLGFCNNAGPGFILGVCGGAVLKSSRAGLYLYLVHALSAVLCGVLLGRAAGPARPAGTAGRAQAASGNRAPGCRQPRRRSFAAAVRDSFAAVWSVCGYVVLFAVALRLLTLPLPARLRRSPFYPLLTGLVEMTNGVLALSPGRIGFVLCAVLLGWGGLSVHAQTLSVLEDSGLSMRRFFPGKLLQAILSAALALPVSGVLYRA